MKFCENTDKQTHRHGHYNTSPSPYGGRGNNCSYFEPDQFCNHAEKFSGQSYFHLNCRGLSSNWESFRELLCDLHGDQFSFDIIGISEVFNCENDKRLSIPGYHDVLTRCRHNGHRGGVALFIKENIQYKIREDISVFIPHIFESLFIEINTHEGNKSIIGVIYRPNSAPKADLDIFTTTLQDIMNIINTERRHSIIMGDMNIDLFKSDTHTKTNEYLESLFTLGFSPVITLPTRLTSSSATLIDHIYTNKLQSTNSGIIITDVADHFGVFHITKENKVTKPNSTKQARYFSQKNIDKFQTLLEHTNFDQVIPETDNTRCYLFLVILINCPNKAYNTFVQLYMTAFDQSFPLRIVKANTKFIKREPWMTPGLLNSSRTKAKLLTKKLNKPNTLNIDKYRIYNNTYNTIKRSMKVQYYNTMLKENKYNITKSWSILKVAIGKRNDKSSLPHEFIINNNPVTDNSEIANNFNEYFANIGPITINNVPLTENKYTDYLPDPLTKSMFLDPVDIFKVVETTKKLKTKTSSGHDEMSTKLPKETIHNM